MREFLASYAQEGGAQQLAAQSFIDSARRSQANEHGARWSRADAYDGRFPSQGPGEA